MISGLKQKLLLALLFSNLIVVGIMSSLMYLSYKHGFTNYLKQLEREELQPFAAALAEGYRLKGSWQFLQHNKETWGLFLSFLPGGVLQNTSPEDISGLLEERLEERGFGKDIQQSMRPLLHRENRDAGSRPPGLPRMAAPDHPQPPTDTTSLNWRISLLDAGKNRIFGKAEESKEPLLLPLRIDEKVIGWLSISRLQWLERGLARKYLDSQLIAVFVSACVALAISLLVSLPLGNSIIRPVMSIIHGIRNIARGNLTFRIEQKSRDEFQELIDDFNQLVSTLEKNSELRKTMMAEISHELRTPVAVLRANIEAIQDGIRPCDDQQLQSLHRGIGNLSSLIDDLFLLALSDSGNMVYRKRDVDVVNLLQRSCQLYARLFEKRNIELAVLLQDTAGVDIFADPDRLNQVFSNILNNSYRYTDSPGKVQVCCERRGDNIALYFDDSSPGVARSSLKKLFDRFFRVDPSRSRKHGGTGLGLALCKSIIEAHDGRIEAAASPLGGLAITLFLPIHTRKE